mgnify:FL=1
MFGWVGYALGHEVCLISAFIPYGSMAGTGLCLLVPWGDDQTLLSFLQSCDETQRHHERGTYPLAVSRTRVRRVQNTEPPA